MKPQDRSQQNPAGNQPPPRLREGSEGMHEPSARWAVSLLGQARPYQTSPNRQGHIWASLQAVDRVPRARRLRLAGALALLLASGLFASAALAQWPGWLARAIHTAPTELRASSPANRATANAAVWTPPLAHQSPAGPSASALETPGVPGGSGQPRRTPEASKLLLDAMRALRVEHRPERARTILARYLAHHPGDPLAEEALVMLVEAAVAHGDSDAPTLAARYFTLYPQGGFADQVRRALAGAASAP